MKQKSYPPLVSDLNEIAIQAQEKSQENDAFITFLRSHDAQLVDKSVSDLDHTITPQIDCTTCGNCCKTLMINVTDAESKRMADYLQLSQAEFESTYVEKSDHSDRMIINSIPCHFLSENKCTAYPARFGGCREFPALDKPNFNKRLFTVFMHYDRCPIIYNVIERLKVDLAF